LDGKKFWEFSSAILEFSRCFRS